MKGNSITRALPDDRPGEPVSAELRAFRERFVGEAAGGDVEVVDRDYAGVPCRVVIAGTGATVLYLHGGGYRMGSPAAYAGHAARLAIAADATVVLVGYRLAPEYPFPAGLRDAVNVYEALRAEDPEGVIIAAGDSAGGGLAAAVSVAASKAGATGPDGLALLSPWLDLRCEAATFQTATDPLFGHETALIARSAYLQGHDHDDALVSPLRADGSPFPPTLIQVGATETLLDDALAFASRLAAEGVSCHLEAVADRGHTWPVMEPNHPDSHQAVASFGRFVRQVAGR